MGFCVRIQAEKGEFLTNLANYFENLLFLEQSEAVSKPKADDIL
jgi:hypothetical protein